MGRVYLADTADGRPLAIKVVRPEFADDPSFRRRFEREVDTARRVEGRYTAPVIDAGPRAPQPWLATAYVPGPSLRDAVDSHGPLPEESVLALVAGVAEALRSIHAAGVVHRDLKPSNVILAVGGPKVIDFGIARAADVTSLTQTGAPPGTPAYMSPEHVRGEEVTSAADVFALGVLANFAATGKLAFGGGTDPAVPYRILEREPNLEDCPKRVRSIVLRCLEKDPRRRPGAAEVSWLCQAASEARRPRRRHHFSARSEKTGWSATTLGPSTEDEPQARRARPWRVAAWAALGAVALTGATIALWPEGETYSLDPIEGPPGAAPPTVPAPGSTSPPPSKISVAVPNPAGRTLPTEPSTAAPPPGGPVIRYGFDRDTYDWRPLFGDGGIGISVVGAPTHAGTGALWLASTAEGSVGVGVDTTEVPPATAVTYYVYSDGSGEVTVKAFVRGAANNTYYPAGGEFELPTRTGWFPLTFTTPAEPITTIGIEVHSSTDDAEIGLDSVTW
jgi:serine/threonine protein kinase